MSFLLDSPTLADFNKEWMPSTPMHVALYKAFNWTPPRFGHVPLLVDHDRQKLSKRNADIDLSSFRDKQGIFPATLINFAALLGWSHRCKSDVLSLKQLEQIVCQLDARVMPMLITAVRLENHQRQHGCYSGETLVSAKGARATIRCKRWPGV